MEFNFSNNRNEHTSNLHHPRHLSVSFQLQNTFNFSNEFDLTHYLHMHFNSKGVNELIKILECNENAYDQILSTTTHADITQV